MTKYEFLGDLSRLLSDLSEEERNEALQYYEDYFTDAGREQEQAVILELESPEKVAAKIRETETEQVQYGEQGQMKDAAYPQVVDHNDRTADSEERKWGGGEGFGQTAGFQQESGYSGSGASAGTTSEDRSNQILKWVLLIVLAIIALPVIVPVIGGVLITIVVLLFTLFMALFGTGIGLGIGGVASMFIGLYHAITANVADAVLGIGAGLVMLPIGIILCYLGGLILIKLAPGIWNLCQKIWFGICSTAQKLFD